MEVIRMLDWHWALARTRNTGLAALLALAGFPAPGAAWERAHGDGANLNFENAATGPAGALGSKTVSGLGTFAVGAGPVIAADGTIYLGNEQGEVIALPADGTPFWRRQITVPQGNKTQPPIVASPVIGSDGTVYVVGAGYIRDHRAGKPPEIYESSLHRFTASGGYLGATMFPTHNIGGHARAAPNVWRFQGKEMVVVPAFYGYSVRLIGFDSGGAVVADQLVTAFDATIVGGNSMPTWQNIFCGVSLFVGCLGMHFERQDPTLLPPPPGAGIFTFAGGGTPFVLVSDHKHDVVGYSFSGGAFVELFRVHDEDLIMRSAPTILPDGHTLIGVSDAKIDTYDTPVPSSYGRTIFTGPNQNKVAPVKNIGATYAVTRLADGRVLLHNGFGQLTVLQNNAAAGKATLPGSSVVAPVASQTHVFASMSDAFVTLDAATLNEVSRVNWSGGGDQQPAIGPKGHVYAIAANVLHVFPPPRKRVVGQNIPEPNAPVLQTVGSKAFNPPLLPSGNRLFACEKLDGDDCGKSGYNAIATAFCKTQGFVGAGQTEVDSKKVKAETLDGRFCSKKKCKVFDRIVCANN